MVDTIFADVAQPDQARIVAINAHSFLKNGGHVVISIKVSFCRYHHKYITKIQKVRTPRKNAFIVQRFEQSDCTIQFCVQKMQTELQTVQTLFWSSLIWVYTIWPDLSVRVLAINPLVTDSDSLK